VKISLFHFGTMIALWLSGPVFAAQSPYQPVQPDAQAVATASKWLSVVDAGNYDQGEMHLRNIGSVFSELNAHRSVMFCHVN
jgi:hypothetical protein